MAEGDHNKGVVCVTGGTGFLASWLIMRMMEQGYSVHTTIRPDPEQRRDISFLTSLPNASKKLKIFYADLGDPNSFDEPIEGCVGVFHVATPVDFENKQPEETIVNRAIYGTLAVLKSCMKSKTVRRVVYTSSASAVVFNENKVDVMDESFWSNVDYIRSLFKGNFGPYMISKTLTEDKALEFAAQHGLDLVTVVPSFIVGPFICPKFPGSVRTGLAMLLGEREQYPSLLNVSMVHTDDVARTHIFLFENLDVKGRYNCSALTITIEKLSKFLAAKYPEFPIPTLESLRDVTADHKTASLSSEKLLNCGFKFKYGLDEMFGDAVQCCRENGYI